MSAPLPEESANPALAPSPSPVEAPPGGEHHLDPFIFHGYTVSAIGGIGGTAPSSDPSYAFHTPYVPLARGRNQFTVRFDNLRAKIGTLVLRVHMLSDEPGSSARVVISERIQLNRMVLVGEISVAFEAFRGATYALMGSVAGQCDAEASGISVTVARPYSDADAARDGHADGRASLFGREDVRRAGLILKLATPQLAFPRSQAATPNQFEEPIFQEWDRAFSLESRDPLDRWTHVFGAHGLATYGAIGPGSRGLVLGPVAPQFGTWLDAAGADVTFADTGFEDRDWVPESLRCTVDLRSLPRDLADFDFACSLALGDRLDSPRDVAEAIEASFAALRPMAFAVHVFGTGRRRPGFTRVGIERLALTLISRGHNVSQLRCPAFCEQELAEPGAFGLVVRRAKVSY